MVLIPLVITVKPVDVVGSIESPVRDKDNPAASQFLFYAVDDRAHVHFFGFVPGKEVIGYGDPVPVHQETHFDDRVRPVVLFRPALPVFWGDAVSLTVDREAVIIQLIDIRAPDVEVIIRTVKIGSGEIPFAQFF